MGIIFRDKKVIDGYTYTLLGEFTTIAKARKLASWQRKGGFSARIERVSRGNYKVWGRS